MEADKNTKVSVVIRCCNEEKHIAKLLDGVFHQTINDVEIIVVDSGSTDSTLDIVSKYPVKIVSIKPEEFSFGYSLNRGCNAAQGEVLVFASAHVYPVYNDWLKQLISPLDSSKTALSYGKQRGNKVTKYSEKQVFSKWFPDEDVLNQGHPFCNNANVAIRKELWVKHSYDENLTGLEDLDWAKRVIADGYNISYVAKAEVIHIHEESPAKVFNRYRREAIALKQIYPENYMSTLDLFYLIVSNVFSDYYHAWRDGVFVRNVFSIPLFRVMQFMGSYRGFRQTGPITNQLKKTFYYPLGLSRRGNIEGQEEKMIDYSKQDQENE